MEEKKGERLSKKRKHSALDEEQPSHKKHKPENNEPDKRPFEEKYKEFVDRNKSFIETLKHENSVLLVKNSPYQAFGNYSNYYRLRCSKRWEDPRTKAIRREWINDRKCLDIGCNEGILTITLAIQYRPKVIIGCDIDYTLINKAISHLRSLQKNKTFFTEIAADSPKSRRRKELLRRLQELPKSFTVGLSIPAEQACVEGSEEVAERLIFRQENYVADMETGEKYDTILCLSTAKWVHLHYGDVGIKALFYKVYRTLNEGGIFVFEPQPWKSYKKKKHLDETMKKQYKEIRFFPNQFEDFLVSMIGFRLIEKAVPEESVKTGYNSRPLFILQK
eukprot:TRINITY_DN5079_c0_g4_i1.p1 TRINITY_DN5079_c0_g4~~TRINITY_DN5079_c0_g4_i1.p1  ORF type:complete len:334 (+),score=93.29 TRINITY_DN5079_c0_g4_i1:67-1068(+)